MDICKKKMHRGNIPSLFNDGSQGLPSPVHQLEGETLNAKPTIAPADPRQGFPRRRQGAAATSPKKHSATAFLSFNPLSGSCALQQGLRDAAWERRGKKKNLEDSDEFSSAAVQHLSICCIYLNLTQLLKVTRACILVNISCKARRLLLDDKQG